MRSGYKEPMVATSRGVNCTSRIPAATATMEGGILPSTVDRMPHFVLPSIGHRMRMAMPTPPTMRAWGLKVEMDSKMASSFSPVSMALVPGAKVRPRKSLICPTRMVTAIPAVKPVVMVMGMYLISAPKRQMPMRTRRIPAMTVARISPSVPWVATTPATMVAKAAVGPEMLTRLPPRKAITKPATMAV